MILGFIIAARFREDNFAFSILSLMIGIITGSTLMHFTEQKLHKTKYEATLKSTVINIILFVILAVPFLFYFSLENKWLTWKTDVIFGILVGIVLTIGQSATWEGSKSRMVIHGTAMAVSFPLMLVGIRYALRMEAWGSTLLLGLLITLLGSVVIVLIDYRSMIFNGSDKDEDSE
jgi:hypothetical protein